MPRTRSVNKTIQVYTQKLEAENRRMKNEVERCIMAVELYRVEPNNPDAMTPHDMIAALRKMLRGG